LTSKHPKGVKASDYRSGDAAVQYKYTAKFKVPGKYQFVCTYHKTVMKTTVTVKK
jgi:plastocyanin